MIASWLIGSQFSCSIKMYSIIEIEICESGKNITSRREFHRAYENKRSLLNVRTCLLFSDNNVQ